MTLVWIAVIIALVFLLRHVSRMSANRQVTGETPLEILKKRYARGVINKDEYDRIRRDLRN